MLNLLRTKLAGTALAALLLSGMAAGGIVPLLSMGCSALTMRGGPPWGLRCSAPWLRGEPHGR